MPVQFSCPACHRQLCTARRKAGTVVECPVCAEAQRVPQELVVTSADVVWEPPPVWPLGSAVVGVVAAWLSLLVLATALYTSSQAVASAPPVAAPLWEPVAVGAPMLPVPPPLPPRQQEPPAHEPEGVLPLEEPAPEGPVEHPDPVAPVMPSPAPRQPSTSQPTKDAPLLLPWKPLELPLRSVEEQASALMAVPEVTTTRETRHAFFSTHPRTHLTSMLLVQPELATLNLQPPALMVRTGEDALSLHVLSRHMRALLRGSKIELPLGDTVTDAAQLRTLMASSSGYQLLRSRLAADLAKTRHEPKDRKGLHAQNLNRQLMAWTIRKQLNQVNDWLDPSAVVTLLHILQAENATVRLLLVEILDATSGPRATAALALRALFELDPVVRQAAVTALRKRPREEIRPVLLMGLQYPWTPVNENAAAALVALRDYQALNAVEEMLDAAVPRDVVKLPAHSQDDLLIREPVRILHRTNCLMCHAASVNPRDLVRVAIPPSANPRIDVPSRQPRPDRSETMSEGYYSEPITMPTDEGAFEPDVFIRADVTFLRTDFSVNLPSPRTRERFDFTTRTRPATPRERILLQTQPNHPALHPNRPALLYILQQLDKSAYTQRLRKLETEYARLGLLPLEQNMRLNQIADAMPLLRGRDKPDAPTAKGREPDLSPAVEEKSVPEAQKLRKGSRFEKR